MKVNERRTVVGGLIGHSTGLDLSPRLESTLCPPNRGERSTRMHCTLNALLHGLVKYCQFFNIKMCMLFFGAFEVGYTYIWHNTTERFVVAASYVSKKSYTKGYRGFGVYGMPPVYLKLSSKKFKCPRLRAI